MKYIFKIILLLTIIALPESVLAKKVFAPFGLSWGMSEAEGIARNIVTSKGCSPARYAYAGSVRTCVINNFNKHIPKPISFGYRYTLYFHPTKGLLRVHTELNPSPNFDTNKEMQEEVKMKLTDKYGKSYKSTTDNKESIDAWNGDSGGGIRLHSRWLSYHSHEYFKTINDEKAKEVNKDNDAL